MISVDNASTDFKNEDIIVKVVERMTSTDDIIYEKPLDNNGIFMEQITEGNDFTVFVKGLSVENETAIDFAIYLKELH